MNPIRVFALLSHRVPPSDGQPGSTGAPEIDMGHAAALCAGIRERPFRAALAKYALDRSVEQWLSIEIWRKTIERAQRERWETSGKKIRRCGNRLCVEMIVTLEGQELSNFVEMIIRTENAEPTRAITHLVVAEIYDQRLWGQKNDWKKKAAILGVNKTAYFDIWKGRIADVANEVDEWAATAYRHVRKRQADLQAA